MGRPSIAEWGQRGRKGRNSNVQVVHQVVGWLGVLLVRHTPESKKSCNTVKCMVCNNTQSRFIPRASDRSGPPEWPQDRKVSWGRPCPLLPGGHSRSE